jgi:hypothetical protein
MTEIKQELFVVQIIDTATGEVEKELGPKRIRQAEKIEDGLNINLNHGAFHTRVVPIDESVELTVEQARKLR